MTLVKQNAYFQNCGANVDTFFSEANRIFSKIIIHGFDTKPKIEKELSTFITEAYWASLNCKQSCAIWFLPKKKPPREVFAKEKAST